MHGMNMMLKAMGVDPEQITASVKEFGQVVIDLKAQMDRIERKLDVVIGNEFETPANPALITMEKENENG